MGFALVDGVGVTTSETAYMRPPIEPGREGGTVVSVTRTSGGNINGSGCTITTTVTDGVVTGQTVVAGGDGYRVGDVLSVAGTTAATFRVDTVSYTN
jgi:hypothetical protein